MAAPLEFDSHTTTLLGKLSLTDASSRALGINEDGTIVGISERTWAFFYSSSMGLQNLTSMLAAEHSGWTILAAEDINNMTQIVGVGRFNGVDHAVVLTVSVPEPSALRFGLLATAIALCGMRSRLAAHGPRQTTPHLSFDHRSKRPINNAGLAAPLVLDGAVNGDVGGGYGGAIYLDQNAGGAIVNSVITSNDSANVGGVYLAGATGAAVTVFGSILASNGPPAPNSLDAATGGRTFNSVGNNRHSNASATIGFSSSGDNIGSTAKS